MPACRVSCNEIAACFLVLLLKRRVVRPVLCLRWTATLTAEGVESIYANLAF